MRRRGFTLIELLVAMGIIVLLSAIALASTRNIRSGLRLSGGVNTVTAALELGRSLAIQNGEPVLVAFRPKVRTRQLFTERIKLAAPEEHFLC